MLERLHIIICLIAAIVMCITGFLQDITLQQMVFRLILTIIVFFILGIIIRYYLSTTIFKKDETNEIIEPSEDDDTVIIQDNDDETSFDSDIKNDEDEIYR